MIDEELEIPEFEDPLDACWQGHHRSTVDNTCADCGQFLDWNKK